MRLDQLSDDELATVRMCLEETLEAAEDHLQWLDTEEGRLEDNRPAQQASTEHRIGILKKVLGD